MNDILLSAFHDELEKVSGAKRLLRLSKVRHKSRQHEEAYRRAAEAYERRIGRHGLSERQRVDPNKQPIKPVGMLGGPVAGAVAGVLAAADPLQVVLGVPAGMALGQSVGALSDVAAYLGREHLFHRRRGRATKNYLKRIGVPRESIDSVAQPGSQRFGKPYNLKDDAVPAIASRAVRAGSPKDIPTELLRRGQKATPAARPQGGRAEPRRQENQVRARRLARIRNE